MNVQKGHVVGQLLLLGLTVNVLAIIVNLLIVAVSSHLSGRLRRSPGVAGLLQKAMGLMFIGLGVRLATQKIRAALHDGLR